jgi:hypothetical protein
VFVREVVAREKLPDWERLWDDFTQEEPRVDSSRASQPTSKEEEIVALHAKKGSGRGSRDMSKVKRFACHKTNHYASQCPNKMDDFAEKFEEFSLVTFLSSSSVAGYEDIGAWFVDNGSSRHMTGMRSMFLSVLETNSDLHVRSGASTMHTVKGVGCVRF